MARLETVIIVVDEKDVIINKCDFDEKKHTLKGQAKPAAKRKSPAKKAPVKKD